jgi:hypothetical protein
MIEIQNPQLRGRRLEPLGWRVRDAMSPLWSGYGWRLWALLLCDEGIAAFEWPRPKYWREMLSIGFGAGVAHQPSTIDGNSWPLMEQSSLVESPSAILFPKVDMSAIEIRRSRWFTNEVRVRRADGERWVFTIGDARKVAQYAALLDRFAGVSRTGWWPRAG